MSASYQKVMVPLEYTYPERELTKLWKLVLLNQFHDVIPVSSWALDFLGINTYQTIQGSSIKAVYEDSDKHYDVIYSEGKKLMDAALAHLFGQASPERFVDPPPQQTQHCSSKLTDSRGVRSAGELLVAINTTSYCRKEVIEIDATGAGIEVVHAQTAAQANTPPPQVSAR